MDDLSQIAAITKHALSKSTFMYGCQCPKRLWLHKFQPELKDEVDEEQATIFQRGTDVGLLAQQLFPGGVNAAPPTPFDYNQSVEDTARYILQGCKIIYEAAFHVNDMLCAMDILVNENGKWYAYEVKSSTKVKPAFIQDAAFQYYVITKSGIDLENIFITHLNNKYIRRGNLELRQLFSHVSVKKEVLDLQSFIERKEAELKTILTMPSVPNISTGDHCHKPYPCDFYGHCSQGLPPDDPEEEFINHEAIKVFLSELRYPLYYMDFETWSSAVPECDGYWSYRQIPFQYSVHVQQTNSAELKHHYYLADHPHSSMLSFAENLLNVMGSRGSVIVYNKNFENLILNQIRNDYPSLKTSIENVQSRMVDLMSPFRKNYRVPEMRGSYSIKYVLPALVPELVYDTLSIPNGSDASAAFFNLRFEKDEAKIAATRNALLEYCGMDTLAMVKILEKLSRGNSS